MMKPNLNILKISTALTAALMLTACGGGGGSSFRPPVTVSPPPPPPPPPPSLTTYTPGVFAAESTFKDRCAVPRTGINPETSTRFPDRAGSTALENFWIRSWSNRTYLFFDEITDRNPNTFTSALDYFETQKTTAVTTSGTPKDQFHFTIPTDEYQQSVSSGASSGYGMRLALLETAPPRDIRVAYTENTGPASANLVRGTVFLEVDGVDAVNGNDVDTLNAALFPSEDGETHTFTVRDPGATDTRTFSMTSALVTREPVLQSKVIDTSTGKVGYMLFNTFGTSIAEEDLVEAVRALAAQDVDDLVLDLRYNGGGFLDIAGQLGYMIAGSTATNNRTFDKLTFNSKFPNTNPVTGQSITPTPFHDEGLGFSVTEGTPLPSLDLPRVFILSTDATCSASEAVINGLRGIFLDVVLIGTRTCGKPYGFYPTDNCGTTYFTIQFSGANDQGFGDYADGFSPETNGDGIGEAVTGCTISDDFLNPLGDEGEGLLAAALTYRETGACPVPPVTSLKTGALSVSNGKAILRDESLALGQTDRLRRQRLLEQSRILTAPTGQDTR